MNVPSSSSEPFVYSLNNYISDSRLYSMKLLDNNSK
jgi:hypothetical protein